MSLLASRFSLLASRFSLLASRFSLVLTLSLGASTVHAGDGAPWASGSVPEVLDLGVVVSAKGLTWQYVGADESSVSIDVHQEESWYFEEPGRQRGPQTLADAIVGTEWVDEQGRRWEVVAVDATAVSARIEAYDRAVIAAFGVEPYGTEAEANGAEEAAGWVSYTPHTWYADQCVSGGSPEIERWDSDNRALVSNPMNVRERKAVFIQSSANRCSGVMVDSDTVLTAAHCLYNGSGGLMGNTAFTVCTHGNYQCPNSADPAVCAKCIGSTARIVGPDWNISNPKPEDDYALIHLGSAAGVGWMALSTASDGVISSATAYMSGYPAWVGGASCTQTLITNDAVTIDDAFNGRFGYQMSGSITHTPSKKIGTDIDSSIGQSGSPVFYYPDGCCGSHFVTGLNTGHYSGVFSEYTVGPKARDIRDWVISNMD